MGFRGIASRIAAGGMAIGMFAALAACGDSSDGQGAAEASKVTVVIGSPALSPSTANVAAVPLELGYYEEQGLDVEIQPSQGANEAMQLLSAGKADFVVGGSSSFYQAALLDPDVRVVSLTSANTWKIMVPEDSEITSIEQLQGEKVGVQALASATYQFGQAAAKASGVEPQEVSWVPVGLANQVADAFKSKQIVAYSTYYGQAGAIERALGKKLVSLPTPLDKIHGLAGIATTKEMLEEHRDVVVKVLTAMYQGGTFAQANPEAAVQIHWKDSPEQKPAGLSLEEALALAVPDVVDRYESFVAGGPSGEIGVIDDEDVATSIDFLVDSAIIKERIEPDPVVDLSPSVDANDFDPEAVKEQAADWKP